MLSTNKTIIQIKEAIDNQKPFLLTRCGDGESIIMDGSKDKFDFVTKRQFGLILHPHHRLRLQFSLIEAYIHSDIIGIPTKKHFELNAHWANAEKMLYREVFNIRKKLFCSIDNHMDMLEYELYGKWLTGLPELFVIGSRDIKDGLKRKFGVKDVYWFQISGEKKFESDKSHEPHYPNQYEKVCRWIPEDTKGKVLIFGAGVAGKIYGKFWKDHGGIAVDIGSAMDWMAGKVTRGPERGSESYNEKYKL